MTDLRRLLAPETVAIVGLSADPAKHGGRVLANLRKLGFSGTVWGVNPKLPSVEGIEVVAGLGELPVSPDAVVCAVPAKSVVGIVREAGAVRAGAAVVFAGGFAEMGDAGRELQEELLAVARSTGVRVLGPNSGGVIRPGGGLAMSFLTCLDRPAGQIRSGPVGLVTQSGGTGSYVHNLAAERGSGLAVSISTGNEVDLGLAEGIAALCDLEEVRAIAVVLETVRDGPSFIGAVGRAHSRGKPVVACRIGTSARGRRLMTTHTGAMAGPAGVLDGVLNALGVTITETPGELLEVAEVMAGTALPQGDRVGVVTHSGGMAILLTDLAEQHGVRLPPPGATLQGRLAPLLDYGSSENPLDMGGIIGGPERFERVVGLFADSGDFDTVLAVSTAHPPAHTAARVEGLLALEAPIPIVHLWMAGDVAGEGLVHLRAAGKPVTEEPRAAMRALGGLSRLAAATIREPVASVPTPAGTDQPLGTEHAVKALLASWGLPVVDGALVRSSAEAAQIAAKLGGPVVVKINSPDIFHKTEVGGIRLGIHGSNEARRAYAEITAAVTSARPDARVEGVRVERQVSGVEAIVGAVHDPVFGPMMLVGLGGTAAEALGAEVLAPAPLSAVGAQRLVGRVRGLELALRRFGDDGSAVVALADLVSAMSMRFVASGLSELEVNPAVWTGEHWEIVDAVAGKSDDARDERKEGAQKWQD